MTDFLMRLEPDGGEIQFVNGQPVMTDSIDTCVLLSLFGGNELDSGLASDVSKQWWGNCTEQDAERRYRSETQHLLRAISASTANLRRVEDAAARDLAWLVTTIALSLEVVAGIPGHNRVSLDIKIVLHNGGEVQVKATQPWNGPDQ